MIRAVLRLAAVLSLVAIVVAAWLHLPGDGRSDGAVGSAPNAASTSGALEKLRSVLDGRVEEVSFDSGEVEALLAGPLREYVPTGASPPSVAFDRGTVLATVPVPVESALPLPDVPVVAGIIPDTVRATARALLASADGFFSVHLERMTLAGIPIPRFLAASIARRLGVGEMAQVSTASPEEAMSWPLPPGIEAIYIDGDRLVLRGGR